MRLEKPNLPFMENATYYLIVVALAALAFLIVYLWKRRAYHIPNPVEAEGEVVDIETLTMPGINPINLLRGNTERSARHYPVVRFQLDEERRVRFRNRKGYKYRDQYPIGEEVTVIFSKENPLLAMIKE